MNNFVLKFALISFIVLGVSLCVHYEIISRLDLVFNISTFFICYAVNYFLALAIFIVIDKIRVNQTELVGYIFLFGSLLKFLVYFTLIYPIFLAEGPLTKFKFLFFFIPYAICLISEVTFLVKLLNMNEKNR